MVIGLVMVAFASGVALLAWICAQLRIGFVHVYTEIEIAADKAAVWSVLADFASYRDWNPLMVEVQGIAAPGERIDWTSRLAGKTRQYNARIERADPLEELSWIGPVSTMGKTAFWGWHRFVVEDIGDGRVRLINKEWFGGVIALTLARFLRHDARDAYEAANAELKRRAESLVAR